MPKRRGRNISQAERLRGLLRIVAIDGDQWLRFDENTVAGLGFTAWEQRALVAAYKIRTTRRHCDGVSPVVTMENAERLWEEWRAEWLAEQKSMLTGD